jgi:hypothetical protein
MKLYHYSNIDIKDNQLKVKYFNTNEYTFNDFKACNINRIFLFTNDIINEYRFKYCKYKYIVNIPCKALYNLKHDKQGIIKKYNNINGILKHIIKLGYKGIIYNIGYDIACLFYNTKINKKIKQGIDF